MFSIMICAGAASIGTLCRVFDGWTATGVDFSVFTYFEDGPEFQDGSILLIENRHSAVKVVFPMRRHASLGSDDTALHGIKKIRFQGNGGKVRPLWNQAFYRHNRGRICQAYQGAAVHKPTALSEIEKKGHG
jgi:hypothetical protein